MGNKMKEVFEKTLQDIKDNNKKYAIWGAGATGKGTISYINNIYNNDIAPEFFIDNNPSLWNKNNVISPSDFFNNYKKDIDLVLICVYVAEEVQEQLRNEGYSGEILPVSINAMYSEYYADFFQNNIHSLSDLKNNMLNDDKSIKTVDTFFEVAKTGDISLWKPVNGNSIDKLIEPEVVKLSNDEVLVEVGAFIGDTTKRFVELCGGHYKKILGFEPDPDNYRELKKVYLGIKDAVPYQLAAGERNETVKFFSGKSESGYVSAEGDIEIESVRLDSFCDAKNASFIKISTNGLELEVLKGSEELIKKNKPTLSYYCALERMWQIPIYLRSIVPEYKFYIRHYGIGMQAMIGYAIIE